VSSSAAAGQITPTGVANVRDLTERLDTPTGVANVRDLTERLDAHTGVANVRDLTERLDAHAGVGNLEPVTPSGPDPAALSPEPPPGNLRIPGPLRILKSISEPIPLLHEPPMSGTQVNVTDWIISVFRYRFRLILCGSPEVCNETVSVTDYLQLSLAWRR
jgi:hypothetical protein